MGKEHEMHFANKEDYDKWLSFGHIHGKFTEHTQPEIFIKGREHKVKHNY